MEAKQAICDEFPHSGKFWLIGVSYLRPRSLKHFFAHCFMICSVLTPGNKITARDSALCWVVLFANLAASLLTGGNDHSLNDNLVIDRN